MLRIALPNKGALSEDAMHLVREAGYKIRRGDGDLLARDPDNEVEFFFLRPRDIALYVSNGTLDLGITGRDLAEDSEATLVELLPLQFGKSSFRYAVPKTTDLTPDTFHGLRIATSYPNIVRHDLERRGVDATIVELDGAVEISIQLGVADAVADVVQTGRTLEQAGLKVVGDVVLQSEALLVARSNEMLQKPGVRTFVERLRGIVVARAYAIVEYDVEEVHLTEAMAITPGLEAPTVAPLSKAGWVAVKSLALRKDVPRILDHLVELGARGILVTDIRTCRI